MLANRLSDMPFSHEEYNIMICSESWLEEVSVHSEKVHVYKVCGTHHVLWTLHSFFLTVKWHYISYCSVIASNRIRHWHLDTDLLCAACSSCHWMINTSLIFISSDGIIYSTGNTFIWKLLTGIKHWAITNKLLCFCQFVCACVLHLTCFVNSAVFIFDSL